jgi:hypothetical protein
MAGRGPAPKAVGARRNRSAPQRGEWKDLGPPRHKVPGLPKRGEGRGSWSPRTRRAWVAWWSDPVSSEWSPSDVELVEHLADVMEEWVRDPGTSGRAAEVRQLRDVLGLTPKGRQDRRWRVVVGEVEDLGERRSASERMAELRQRASGSG